MRALRISELLIPAANPQTHVSLIPDPPFPLILSVTSVTSCSKKLALRPGIKPLHLLR